MTDIRNNLYQIGKLITDSLGAIEKIRKIPLEKEGVIVEIVIMQRHIWKIRENIKSIVNNSNNKSFKETVTKINAINSLAEDIILRIGPMEGAKFAKELAKLEKNFIEMVNYLKESYTKL